jgi:hypothetical protein
MRKALWIAALAVLLLTQSVFAASVSGKWSGTMTVDGKNYSASVKLTSGGSFSATSNGLTVTGSYSISGNTVRMDAWGVVIKLKLKEKSGKQVLSGSASEFGKDGSITLSRKAPAESDSKGGANEPTVSGAWTLEAGGRVYSLKLYKAGFAHWSEGPAGGEPDAQLYAALDVRGGALVLKALGEADTQQVPPGLERWQAEDSTAYEIPYALGSGQITIEGLPAFSRTGEALDDKPCDTPFLPHLSLRQGDRGQAVAWLQQRLIGLKYLEGEADGDFGQKTVSALKRFQADHGLDQDGVAGPDVVERLAS